MVNNHKLTGHLPTPKIFSFSIVFFFVFLFNYCAKGLFFISSSLCTLWHFSLSLLKSSLTKLSVKSSLSLSAPYSSAENPSSTYLPSTPPSNSIPLYFHKLATPLWTHVGYLLRPSCHACEAKSLILFLVFQPKWKLI